MAVKFTGNTTTGAAADANSDLWITKQGEYVTGAGNGFTFLSYTSVNYLVEGTVAAQADGIASGSLSSSNSIKVAPTGSVYGESDGMQVDGSNHEILNEGTVTGDGDSGIEIQGDQAFIRNLGSVVGQYDGIEIAGDYGEIENHGTVHSRFGSGLVVAGIGGVIDNTALASGAFGVALAGSGTKSVVNSGRMTGANDGFNSVGVLSNGSVNLLNTGVIETDGLSVGDRAVEDGNGDLYLRNDGTIDGDIQTGNGIDVVDTGIGVILNGTVDLGANDDTLIMRQVNPDGILKVDAGLDSDTLDLSGFGSAIWVDLAWPGAEAWTKGTDSLTTGTWRRIVDFDNGENVVGSVYVDRMRGNDADNTFSYNGDALLPGTESIDGRAGSDTADFSNFGSALWIDLDYSGTEAFTKDMDTLAGGTWRPIADLTSIENAVGTRGLDQFYGTAGNNTFGYVHGFGSQAVPGVEIMDGRGGSDTADFSHFGRAVWVSLTFPGNEVQTQDDTNATDAIGTWRQIVDLVSIENIIGTELSDFLGGDNNANTITAGAGNDDIRGRGGNDLFIFANTSSGEGAGLNELLDFSSNDAEKIDLSGVTSITSFSDLFNNHLVDAGGTARIDDGNGLAIELAGWTVAQVGSGQPISENDFIF